MTDREKLELTGVLAGDPNLDDALTLEAYLSIAENAVLSRLYPFGTRGDRVVPNEYATLQCEIASFLYNKRGAEGQIAHSENGVSRTYGNADIPKELLSRIAPYVGVI